VAEAGLNYFLFYADSDNEENIQTAYHHQGNVASLPDSVETRPVARRYHLEEKMQLS
jgi:hypothetical protein